MKIENYSSLLLIISLLVACGGGAGGANGAGDETVEVTTPTEQDNQLREHISLQGLSGNPAAGRVLPTVDQPLPQLGKLLFFSKSLGGGFDSACVTCHHPMLGGADQLSLAVGVEAVSEDLLGPGRMHSTGAPPVPRNSPTVFNVGLWDSGLFMDSRVESLGKENNVNGALSPIRTPDSSFGVADVNAGVNLVAAQARFPVTSADEMKTDGFESGSDNEAIRSHLAARIGNYGVGSGELASTTWVSEFQHAFSSTDGAELLVTFDNIALAIAEYERSMVFVDNPWRAYIEGDDSALTAQQKAGALLFYSSVDNGGAGCVSCHNGDLLSDGGHHVIGFPQIGPGKGDGISDSEGNSEDYGRERETGTNQDRYRFRTTSLLNVEVTAPYGHAGSYQTLEQVVRHYVNPQRQVTDYFNDGGWCQLPQFSAIADCADLYPGAQAASQRVLEQLNQNRNSRVSQFRSPRLNDNEVDQVVSFLQALTDPCVRDRECLAPWIADPALPGPDGQQLNAIDNAGDFL